MNDNEIFESEDDNIEEMCICNRLEENESIIKGLEMEVKRLLKVNTERRNICKNAIEKYGEFSQINMVFEEVAELQKELCKYLRNGNKDIDTKAKIAGEIADVEIMLEQMKLIFDIEAAVDRFTKIKLNRLEDRLAR